MIICSAVCYLFNFSLAVKFNFIQNIFHSLELVRRSVLSKVGPMRARYYCQGEITLLSFVRYVQVAPNIGTNGFMWITKNGISQIKYSFIGIDPVHLNRAIPRLIH